MYVKSAQSKGSRDTLAALDDLEIYDENSEGDPADAKHRSATGTRTNKSKSKIFGKLKRLLFGKNLKESAAEDESSAADTNVSSDQSAQSGKARNITFEPVDTDEIYDEMCRRVQEEMCRRDRR